MHIVVTGASSGIGEALARELGRDASHKLTLIARRGERLERIASEIRAETHVIARDLAMDPDGWIEEAEAAHGPIDVLVNNAGIHVVAKTADVDIREGEASIALNLTAPLRMIVRVLPSMIRRRRGHIVNVASMAAIAPTPNLTYYNASKAGLAAASEALRGELRGTGVSVTTVYPGIIPETDMARAGLARFESSFLLRLQPTGTAAELARLVGKAIAKKKARVIFPRTYALARLFPTIVRWFMDRFSPPLVADHGVYEQNVPVRIERLR
jgi:short-subunit dehydrogenase